MTYVRPTLLTFFAAFITGLCLVLSSCFPTEVTSRPQDIEYASEVPPPPFVEKELDENLSVSANVDYDPGLQWKAFEVTYRVFDQRECLDVFAQGKEIGEQYSYESVNPQGGDESTYLFPDGTALSIELGAMRYTHPAYRGKTYDNVVFATGYTVRGDLGEVYRKGELASIGKDASVELVRDVVTKLGIPVAPDPTVYALDYDTLMSEWEGFELKDGTPASSWEAKDEAYLIEFHAVVDGLPVSDVGYTDLRMPFTNNGSRIYGVVSQEGLISFVCSGIYEAVSSRESSLVSLDVALEAVGLRFRDIIITDPITITRASAAMIPAYEGTDPLRLVLKPAWVFSVEQEQTLAKDGTNYGTRQAHFNILIDGATGAEIHVDLPA
jgi:hypothetical protein